MAEVIVKTRNWGNSIGVTLPKEIIEKENIKANEEIRIEVKRRVKMPSGDFFGNLKGSKIDSQKFKDSVRREEW
ncbi:MAG: AbrB/MazE/SpoVT family DNA-binding domain-containing protein [Candidatus Diapherotrites archaeon]